MKRPFEEEHFEDISQMINFFDYFTDDIYVNTIDGIEYGYMDFYCKDYNCSCSEMAFYIFLEDEDEDIKLDKVFYDYKTKKVKPSKYSYLLQPDFLERINEELAARHEYVKICFKLAQNEKMMTLIRSLDNDEKEPQSSRIAPLNNGVSRNAPCSCGSGKKYKRCCGK